MFGEMFLLGFAAGMLGYIAARVSYVLWSMGVHIPQFW